MFLCQVPNIVFFLYAAGELLFKIRQVFRDSFKEQVKYHFNHTIYDYDCQPYNPLFIEYNCYYQPQQTPVWYMHLILLFKSTPVWLYSVVCPTLFRDICLFPRYRVPNCCVGLGVNKRGLSRNLKWIVYI